MPLSSCWKFKKKGEALLCHVQVSGLQPKEVKHILSVMGEGWRNYAEGTGPQGTIILIFKKHFDTSAEWSKWARSFPYDLHEHKEDGTVEKIKKYRSKSKIKEVPREKAKVCSLCSKDGHNKRTCPERTERYG